jgi:hypothetical protein
MADTAVAQLPFIAGAHEHTELVTTRSFTVGTSQATLDPVDIPAGGYLRGVYLIVSSASGVGGTANADYPFNLLDGITLQDNNGLPIVGPLSGFQLFLANLLGGYSVASDPRQLPNYSGAVATPAFGIRIPVEIDHASGVGSLHNQASNATYRLSFVGNTIANVTSVAYTTPPVITVTIVAEYWTQPDALTATGKPVMTQPPLLGTTQYWSVQRRSGIVSGSNNVPITRTGNLARIITLVGRDSSGARSDACLPNPINLLHDAQTLESHPLQYNIVKTWEKLVSGANANPAGRPVGVACFPFHTFGELPFFGADGDGAGWLPTTEATRLEVSGNIATGGGTLEVIMNDVAVIPVSVADRYSYGDATRHAQR